MGTAPEELRASLEPAVVGVEPGAAASCELRVDNAGASATVRALEVVGPVGEWSWINPARLEVPARGRAVARVVLRPPRSAHVAAGPTPLTVRLVPDPAEAARGAPASEVSGVVEVAGFVELEARLVPSGAAAARTSHHVLVLENRGTAAARATVEVGPEGAALDVVVDPARAEVAPGAVRQVDVTVRARRRLVAGSARRHRFRLAVSAPGPGGDQPAHVVVDGHLAQQPTRALVAVAVVALVAGTGGVLGALGGGSNQTGDGAGGGPAQVAESAVAPGAPVPRYAVGTRRVTFVDASRPTLAFAANPALPTRTLETVVFYPADGSPGEGAREAAPPATADGPFPLIVFAHGSGGLGERYFGLLRAWAGAGYVVAAPVFPFAADPEEASPDDYPNQPGDMSVVIDELLAPSADGTDELAGLVDPERIGAAVTPWAA